MGYWDDYWDNALHGRGVAYEMAGKSLESTTSSSGESGIASSVIASGKVGKFTEPTKLIFLGASITNGMVAGFESAMAIYFADAGYTVEVIASAV